MTYSASSQEKPYFAALGKPQLQKKRPVCALPRGGRSSFAFRGWGRSIAIAAALIFALPFSRASAQELSPKELVKQVVYNELQADKNDHSRWIYLDHDREPGKNVVQVVVETAEGAIRKTIEKDGHALDAEQRQQDEARIKRFGNDPEVRAEKHRNNAQDDKKARALMQMLPDAFLWTSGGESGDTVTLDFKPNPQFQPPTRDARVFAAMAGTLVVDRNAKRVRSVSGRLTRAVTFGWGLMGKLQKGGTFHVEHTEVAPGIWRVTRTQVHIQGHALIFKSINEQQDDETSHYKPAPPSLSLAQAIEMLNSGAAEREIGVS